MKYFVIDNGILLRKQSDKSVMEALLEGDWTPIYNSWKVLHGADPISEEEAQELMGSEEG